MLDGYGDGGGIVPSAAQISTAQGEIDATDANGYIYRHPVTADVTVQALTETATAFTIAGVPAAYEDAVEAALADIFARVQDPGSAYTIYREQIITAAQNALPTASVTNITAPAGDVSVAAAQIGTVGVVTFV